MYVESASCFLTNAEHAHCQIFSELVAAALQLYLFD